MDAFRRGLQQLGYVSGQNIVVAYKYANGSPEQLHLLAAEVTAAKVDVVVAEGSTAAAAVRKADAAVPIVMAFSSDPIAAGLVESLSHPGGYTTGPERPGDSLGR